MTTRIGKFNVPVRYQSRCAIYRFTGGARKGDAGVYAFWTAVFKRPAMQRHILTCRALVGLPAGERFERMCAESTSKRIVKAAREENAKIWEALGRGGNVRYVRPATLAEVEWWMLYHGTDANFAQEVSEPS